MPYRYFRYYRNDTLAVTDAPLPLFGVSATPTRQGTAVDITSGTMEAIAGFSGDAADWTEVDREEAASLAEACGVTLDDLEESVPKGTQGSSG